MFDWSVRALGRLGIILNNNNNNNVHGDMLYGFASTLSL